MSLYVYLFEIIFKDGSISNEYTVDVDDVACIRFIPVAPTLPYYHFFFTDGNTELKRFFGRGFITTGKGKDYCYCIFTDSHNIFINAYTGSVTYTDDRTYQIKSRLL